MKRLTEKQAMRAMLRTIEALKNHHGNVAAAARALGMSRAGLYWRLRSGRRTEWQQLHKALRAIRTAHRRRCPECKRPLR